MFEIALKKLANSRPILVCSKDCFWPNFSPDGNHIRFHYQTGQDPNTIWEISADGTDLHRLLPDWELIPHCCGSWTPDGATLAFSARDNDKIQLLDVATGQVSDMEGSDDLWAPRWSPDGNHIAAISNGSLKLFNVSTGSVETLLDRARFGGWYWAADSQYVYYHDSVWSAPYRSVYRVNIEDKTVHEVAPFGNVKTAWGAWGIWVGVSPEGVPIMLRDLSIHHINVLDWLSE
jgi:Tol biopolymer transport system component